MVKYVLITAAHNEEKYIEKTIISVINQQQTPIEWIIVSDGSNDNTELIIQKYIRKFSFIKLVINNRIEGRDFASKVYAINIGIQNLINSEYNFIGILDADVSFEPDYYFSLMQKFNLDPKLGIAGGRYYDIVNNKKVPVGVSPYSVRGATQFFRKECFQSIGGLKPMKYGGEDALACYAARMNGWRIKNFGELIVIHHRPTGTVGKNIIKTRFRDGMVEYNLGYHPLFQFVKCLRRFNEKPFVIGSLLRFIGYWYLSFKKEVTFLPPDLTKFIRKDQLARIIKIKSLPR